MASKRGSNALLLAMFLTAIWLPLIRQLVGSDPGNETTENRRSSPWPTVECRWLGWLPVPRKRTLETFPDRFEAYYNDHFGFRRPLIRGFNLATIHGWMPGAVANSVGKARPATPVVIGKEGWLYSNHEEDIETYRCAHGFRPQELEAWKDVLLARQAWLAERGIRYLFVVPPSKPGVYPEFLPRAITRVGEQTRVEQLNRKLTEAGAADLLLNLQGALIAGKQEHPTFYRTDIHWNDYGGFVGYRELMNRLRQWYPAAQPRELAEMKVRVEEGPPRVLPGLLDAMELFTETYVVLEPREGRQAQTAETAPAAKDKIEWSVSRSPQAPLGHAVVLHDSFMLNVQPFFNEHWQEVHYFWTREFPAETIDRLRPEIVIQEMAEFFVTVHKPHNPPDIHAPASPQWAKAPGSQTTK